MPRIASKISTHTDPPQLCARPGPASLYRSRKAHCYNICLTRQVGIAEATRAQASRAVWPAKPDRTSQIQRMTRDLQISDRPQDTHREIQRTLPLHKIDQNQNEIRPPAAGIHTQQQDVFFIPPPRAGGGALGAPTPVSTATLGYSRHLLRHNYARTQPLWPYARRALGYTPRCA